MLFRYWKQAISRSCTRLATNTNCYDPENSGSSHRQIVQREESCFGQGPWGNHRRLLYSRLLDGSKSASCLNSLNHPRNLIRSPFRVFFNNILLYFRSFLGVTVTYLDGETLARNSAALACRRLHGRHTYDNLASSLRDIFAEYKLTNKICAVVTDNGSNLIQAFR